MPTLRADIIPTILVRASGPLVPNVVFELEDGSLVAVAFTQERSQANSLSCHIAAWQIGSDGIAVLVDDEDGYVLVETRHTAPAQQIAQLGVQAIASAMMGLVLGQDPGSNPVIQWSGQHWEQMNIRNAIAVAQAMQAPVILAL